MISRTFYILLVEIALATLTCAAPIDSIGASNSFGAVSGNVIQIPVNIPVNACGNSVNVIGAVNPAFGNSCVNSIDLK
ncbi:hypothetical protein BGZ46_004586 [Entomortierella lignicola]|nr:hypothetical protein BGZ46_004586 [Entomortierella lignicola]